MPTDKRSISTQSSEPLITGILSLPHELLQSVFNSIITFEPWTYTSNPESADISTSDQDPSLYTRDARPFSLASVHRNTVGLSSEKNWLTLILSRHPHHLSPSNESDISSAVTQALRRMNARLERLHWAERDTGSIPIVFRSRRGSKENSISADDVTTSRTASSRSMWQYHASVHTEEEDSFVESVDTQCIRTALSEKRSPPMATALVVRRPVAVLKFSNQDVIHLANLPHPTDVTEQVNALLVAVLLTLAQCRILLFENLEKLERDTPIPSIEPHESKDFASPKMSPRPERLRSMSGSTVADAAPHGETLSLSTVTTVYSLGSSHKEVKWAEKRVSEERDVGTSPKRPKLTEYKEVSCGRVATLMDRFEKFHL